MAVADRAAVVSLIEELSDDSILQEARSSEDEEFLFFFLSIRERQSHVRMRIILNVLNHSTVFQIS